MKNATSKLSRKWITHVSILVGMGAVAMAADFPVVTEVQPIPAVVGKRIVILGEGFGEDATDGYGKVWLARCRSLPGAPAAAGMMEYPRSKLLSWSDTRIEMILPHRSAGVVAVTGMRGVISPNLEFDIADECKDTKADGGCTAERVANAGSLPRRTTRRKK